MSVVSEYSLRSDVCDLADSHGVDASAIAECRTLLRSMWFASIMGWICSIFMVSLLLAAVAKDLGFVHDRAVVGVISLTLLGCVSFAFFDQNQKSRVLLGGLLSPVAVGVLSVVLQMLLSLFGA